MRELKSPVCGRQGKIGDRVGLSHRGLGMDGRLVIRLAIRLGWSLRVADLGEFRVDEWGVLSARRCVCPQSPFQDSSNLSLSLTHMVQPQTYCIFKTFRKIKCRFLISESQFTFLVQAFFCCNSRKQNY